MTASNTLGRAVKRSGSPLSQWIVCSRGRNQQRGRPLNSVISWLEVGRAAK
jgi:hypothetical protein